MKIRNGFISNSSSSSFCLIVKEEDHQNIIKDFHPFDQAFLNALMEKETFDENDIRTFIMYNVRGEYFPRFANCYFEYDDEIPIDFGDCKTEKDRINKVSGRFITTYLKNYQLPLIQDKKALKIEVSNTIRAKMYGVSKFKGMNPKFIKKND